MKIHGNVSGLDTVTRSLARRVHAVFASGPVWRRGFLPLPAAHPRGQVEVKALVGAVRALRCFRWVAVLLVVPAVAVAAAGSAALPALDALRARLGVAESAMVVRLDTPRTLAAIDPQMRLNPASLTKLYTAAAALHRWGPDYRFVTRLAYRGRIEAGVLHGDLVFVGAGDPGLTQDQLWELAVAAADQGGLHRVTGDLVIDQSLLGVVACATAARCQALQASDHAYNASLSSAGVNYGTWCVWARSASQPGHPAAVGLCPPALPGIALSGTVRTVARGSGVHVQLWRTTKGGVDTLHVGGTVAAGLSMGRYYVSASDPARLTGALLRSLLAAQGIRVDARVRVVSQPLTGLTPLVSVKGPVLGHELSVMLHYSNDFMADVLALDLARDRIQGSDPPQLAEAGAALGRFAAEVTRAAQRPGRARHAALVIASGSGLTPSNRLSAGDVVALLTRMYHRPALFPAYLAGLSVPRGAPMRMIRGGGHAWLTQTAVKTGSMNDPVSVLGVAGYFRTRAGGWGAFAVLVNGTRSHPHFPWYEAMAAIEHDIGHLAAQRSP